MTIIIIIIIIITKIHLFHQRNSKFIFIAQKFICLIFSLHQNYGLFQQCDRIRLVAKNSHSYPQGNENDGSSTSTECFQYSLIHEKRRRNLTSNKFLQLTLENFRHSHNELQHFCSYMEKN